MLKFLHFVSLVSVLSLLGACENEDSAPPEQPAYLAIVNGEKITTSMFQTKLDEIKQAGKGYFANKESANRIKRDLLERMIDTNLLLQEAKAKQIVLDPKLVEASIRLVDESYPTEGLAQQLASSGRTPERYQNDTKESLLLSKLLKQEVVDRIAISVDEIKKYYEEHIDQFVRPEELRVRQIVTHTQEEAEELRKKIQRGASFEEVARKHSIAPEAKKGGDLGFFPRGRMPPAIENTVFTLWAGAKCSQVVESPYGFHLFKLVAKRPAQSLSLEQARKEIENVLLDDRIKEAERFYIRSLRESANIERDLKRLDRIH